MSSRENMILTGTIARKVLLTILVISIYIIYIHPLLKAPFYFDDYSTIVNNTSIYKVGRISRFFLDNSIYVADNYLLTHRGFITLSYALNYLINGVDPFCFRIINVCIHILCAAMVFLIFKRVFPAGSFYSALLAMGIFLFLPATVQPVAYINSRSESLCVLFMLMTFILYSTALDSKNNLKFIFYLLLSLIPFAISFYCKEGFVIIIPILFAYGTLICPGRKKKHLFVFPLFIVLAFYNNQYMLNVPRNPQNTPLLGIALLIYYSYLLAVYYIRTKKSEKQYHIILKQCFLSYLNIAIKAISVILRRFLIRVKEIHGKHTFPVFALTGFFAIIIFITYSPIAFVENRNYIENIISQGAIFPIYIVKLILPYRMSIIHDHGPVVNIVSALPGFFVLLVVVLILIVSYNKNKKIFFLLFSVFSSLVIYFLVTLNLLFNENRLYMPACFFSVFLAYVCCKTFDKLKTKNLKYSFVCAMAMITIASTCFTGMYMYRLRDKSVFYSYALKIYPDSIILNIESSSYKYSELRRQKEALSELLAFDKRWGDRRYDISNKIHYHYSRHLAAMIIPMALTAGEYDIANKNIDYLYLYHENYIYNDFYKAQYLESRGRFREAKKLIEHVMRDLKADKYNVTLTYAGVLLKLGLKKEAVEALKAIRNIEIARPWFLYERGLLLYKVGEQKRALGDLKSAYAIFIQKGDKENSRIVLEKIQRMTER